MKRTQKSQKRTKFLLLLIVLTAILSITATYAWFSTQRDVEITGMRLNIEVAESMQISLNGEKWVQSISITDMKQFYGSASGTTLHQAKAIASGVTNNNYVPTELLPVSSAGELDTEKGQLKFVQGTLSGVDLNNITACVEPEYGAESDSVEQRETKEGAKNADHPYLVFDMYLRNISANSSNDTLRLNTGSMVFVDHTVDSEPEGQGVQNTGLEYSARVGLIRFGETVSVNETGTEAEIGEKVRSLKMVDLGSDNAEGGTDGAADTAPQISVWEPNHLNHTQYVVSNSGGRVSSTSVAVDTFPIKAAAATGVDTTDDITGAASATEASGNIGTLTTYKPDYDLPAYAQTAGSATTDDASDDVYEWTGGVKAETSNAEGAGPKITDINGTEFGIEPNQISKVRVYVWIEGQDPDCVDLASTGDKLNITLKLIKSTSRTGTNVTYKETTP